MEVTRKNWREALPMIADAIAGADFVSYDFELTGIQTATESGDGNGWRSLQEQYAHLRAAAQTFLPIQLGLCTFTWVEGATTPHSQDGELEAAAGEKEEPEQGHVDPIETVVEELEEGQVEPDEDGAEANAQGHYVARPFNIWLFPYAFSGMGGGPYNLPAQQFACSASSLSFLASHKFDFNKWVREGVPWLSKELEDHARAKLVKDAENAPVTGAERKLITNLDEITQKWMDEMVASIGEWLQTSDPSAQPFLTVPTPSSFHRRLVHQAVEQHFNAALGTSTKGGNVLVSRMTVEERAERRRRLDERRFSDLEDVVGARLVVDALVEHGKPLIGHNSLLDGMFLYQHLVGPLPEQVEDFKAAWRTTFPTVIDTKYLTTTHPRLVARFPSTVLGELKSCVDNHPDQFQHHRVDMHPAFPRYVVRPRAPSSVPAGGAGASAKVEEAATPVPGEAERPDVAEDSPSPVPITTQSASTQTWDTTISSFYHEAGYDAWVTGLVFVRSMGYVAQAGERIQPATLPHINRHRIHRCESAFLDFYQSEADEERPDTFYVFGFPNDIRSSDVYAHFTQWGALKLRWIDHERFLMILQDETKVEAALKQYEANPEDGPYTVWPIARYEADARADKQAMAEGEAAANTEDGVMVPSTVATTSVAALTLVSPSKKRTRT